MEREQIIARLDHIRRNLADGTPIAKTAGNLDGLAAAAELIDRIGRPTSCTRRHNCAASPSPCNGTSRR